MKAWVNKITQNIKKQANSIKSLAETEKWKCKRTVLNENTFISE
jgi:hypothetical protein